MQLLADRLVMLNIVESVSADTVRRRLSENELKPWQQRMWCVPKLDAEYLAKMEDVLALYAMRRKKTFPLVCFENVAAIVSVEDQPITVGLWQKHQLRRTANQTPIIIHLMVKRLTKSLQRRQAIGVSIQSFHHQLCSDAWQDAPLLIEAVSASIHVPSNTSCALNGS